MTQRRFSRSMVRRPVRTASHSAWTLKLTDGNTRLLSTYLPDRESADTVAAKMMADLGQA